ncbi:phospholipase D-like domain-containing protein [Litoribrevibacter euphylliae]|uniref:phospholipase D n=1 Tax=Litoribrevibacter euphylliae TaxID=1834034 RepID=A0ABV7HE48_9GAMM
MRIKELEAWLIEALQDTKLDNTEKAELRSMVPMLSVEEGRFLRNKAFALAKDEVRNDPELTLSVFKWLEKVVKTIDSADNPTTVESSAHFSPGDECRRKILDLCQNARRSIEICVFTISDDSLSNAILKAHQRGIEVRIITDNDKSNDLGSDVDMLSNKGVPVRMDRTDNHMHHKFALFDRATLLNGSFNWTRSASRYNQENIVVSGDVRVLDRFTTEFDRLWAQFG